MSKTKLVKPPIYLFITHLVFFGLSVLLLLDILGLQNYLFISLSFHLIAFCSLLIFLTVDKTLSKSRNYSSNLTIPLSKFLLVIYILFGAYLSWEIGYEMAYDEFLNSF